MGLRFRKSVNLGGFRINISKSGIGYSFGIPGLRLTKKTKGGFRTTTSIPGTGISYVTDSRKRSYKTYFTQQSNRENQVEENPPSEEIQSNQSEFINTLNVASHKNRIFFCFRILAIIGILIGVALLASGIQNKVVGLIVIGSIFAASVVLALPFIPKNAKIKLNIDFDEPTQLKLYNSFIERFKTLCSNYEFYFESDNGIPIQPSKNVKADPLNKLLDGEFDACCIYLQNCFLYFIPNMIIVYQDKVWKGVDYNKVKLESHNIEKTFNNIVPNSVDTEILFSTYKYLNKDGTPNKRYTKENNPQLFICAYAKIEITSVSGLKVDLISSSRPKSESFMFAAKDFIDSFNIYQDERKII